MSPKTLSRSFAMLAIGVLASLSTASSAQSLVKIRVATLPIESAAQVFYAKELGLFAKAGLDVDIQSSQSSATSAAAIDANTLDIAYAPVDSVAAAHQKGVPVVIIAPANEYVSPGSRETTAMVVPTGSTVRDAKNLAGKTIAVAGLHSIAEVAPRVWIDRNGGDSASIKFVEIPFPAMPAAIEAGRVDAAWIAEPFIGVAKKSGRAIGYGFDGIGNHFLVGSWFTTQAWAKDHPDLVKSFALAVRDAGAWANKNPEKSGEILAKYTKVDPSIVATMARTHYGQELSPALTQPLIDVAATYGAFARFPAQEILYVAPR